MQTKWQFLSQWMEQGSISAADAATLLAVLNPTERPAVPTGVAFCGLIGGGKTALLGALLGQSCRPYMLIEPETRHSELPQQPRANCLLDMVLASRGVTGLLASPLADRATVGRLRVWAKAVIRSTQQLCPGGLLVLDRVGNWGPHARELSRQAQQGGWPVALLFSTPDANWCRSAAGVTEYVAEQMEMAVAQIRTVVTHYVLVDVVESQPQVTLYMVDDPVATAAS